MTYIYFVNLYIEFPYESIDRTIALTSLIREDAIAYAKEKQAFVDVKNRVCPSYENYSYTVSQSIIGVENTEKDIYLAECNSIIDFESGIIKNHGISFTHIKPLLKNAFFKNEVECIIVEKTQDELVEEYPSMLKTQEVFSQFKTVDEYEEHLLEVNLEEKENDEYIIIFDTWEKDIPIR
jgi:hypothetical protein